MKPITSFVKLLVYSNLFVSICVAAFTHITYIIYNLPQDNLRIVLLMVFSFSFFTYNIQRFIKFKTTVKESTDLGKRLLWINRQKKWLAILSVFFGIIGLGCTYFINPYSFIILIPMGILSFFYVVPIIPFYSKSPTLRDIPYLKIGVIGLVWGLIVVGLPFIDSQSITKNVLYIKPEIALLQNFLFIIAITLPFDIRDIDYDKNSHLKTFPQLLGVKKSIVLSEILLIGSVVLLYISDIKTSHFYALFIGHVITMIVISFSNKKRKELFFAGLVEGVVIVLYLCVLISEYFSFL